MIALTTKFFASISTLKERLSHHRLIQVFVAVAFAHCLLQAFLQGEALAVSRGGAHLLKEIHEAPKEGLLVLRPDEDLVASPTSSPSTSSSAFSSRSNTSTATSSTRTAAPTTSTSTSTSSRTSTSTTTSSASTQVASSSSRTASSTSSARDAAETGSDDDNDDDDDENEVESRAKRSLSRVKRSHVDIAAALRMLERRDDWGETNSTNPGSMFMVPEITDVDGRVLAVSAQCSASLQWPTVYIERMQTMSIAFICFQLWVLVISFLAVVYESVPHLAAVMIAHFLGLVYAIYQVTQTRFFHRRFHEEIINEACNSDIIPGFWEEVVRFQISIAVFEAVGFLAIAFLAWKLMSVLEWRTFKKLGADRRIARAHAVSLIFQLLLQLLAYFLIAFHGLWLHELCTYEFPEAWYSIYAELSMGYQVFLGVLTGLVVPWLVVGYVAVRKEKRGLMVAFLVPNVLLIGHSIFLTTQKIYMDTMSSFKFLTFVGSVATLVAACTLVFGLICLRNFNRGAKKGISVEWVASFPQVDDKYDPEKGFSEIDLASPAPAVFSVPIPRPQPSFAPSTSFKPSTSYLNNLPPPRRAPSNSSHSFVAGDDGAAPSPPTNPTRRPPPPPSGTILERQGSGSRKAAPAQLKLRPIAPVAIAIDDSSPHSSYQTPTQSAPRSPETLHLRSSWDESTVATFTQGTAASYGTFARGSREGEARMASRWSSSTRTTESSAAQTPAPKRVGSKRGTQGSRDSRQMPQ